MKWLLFFLVVFVAHAQYRDPKEYARAAREAMKTCQEVSPQLSHYLGRAADFVNNAHPSCQALMHNLLLFHKYQRELIDPTMAHDVGAALTDPLPADTPILSAEWAKNHMKAIRKVKHLIQNMDFGRPCLDWDHTFQCSYNTRSMEELMKDKSVRDVFCAVPPAQSGAQEFVTMGL